MRLRAGYKQTDVGVIPEEWSASLLDSVAKRGSGHTPDKEHPEYWDGDIKWVSLKDSDALDKLYIDETAATITPAGIANSSAVVHPAGTVVLSRDAGVGKSAITKSAMAVSQHFMAWQCGPRLDNHFLYYWLQAEKSEFERVAIGNTIKTIGLPYFRALKVPLPPLPEQRVIAGALGDVDALLGALTQLIAKKRDLKQAAMQQLLTGQTRLSGFTAEWEVRPLGDGISLLSGHHVLAQHCNSRGEGVPYLTGPADFPNGTIQHTKFTTRPTTLCDPNDILVTVKGSGSGSLVVPDAVYCISRQLMAIRVREWDRRFIYYSLLQNASHIKAASTGLIPGLSRSDILDQALPLPALPEQTAIATALFDMDAELAALEQRLAKARALKQGMMQELLTGRTRLVGGAPA